MEFCNINTMTRCIISINLFFLFSAVGLIMSDKNPSQPLSAASAVVRNPLSVIAMFVLLVEAITTVTLVQVQSINQFSFPLVWFIILFPTLIALLFFGTLWWRHQFLYSPMEYRSDESFLSAMQRLQRIEARQEAAEINPRTADEEQSLQVVDRLLSLGDVRAAVKVGRTFLEVGQYDVAERIFQYILGKTPLQHADRYNVLANLGYSQVGQKKFEDSITNLSDCISLVGKDKSLPWHNLALAYSHFMLSKTPKDKHHQQYEQLLNKAKNHRWFLESRDFYKILYPEMAGAL